MPPLKTCTDLAKIVSFTCCESCHNDCDLWDMEMCDLTIGGIEYHVCCAGITAYYRWVKTAPTLPQNSKDFAQNNLDETCR